MEEIKRILRPDGVCLISIPNKDNLWKKTQRFVGIDSRDDTDHKIEYSKIDIFNELNSAGLELKTKFKPIVPSFPFHGILSLTAIISPGLYLKSQKLKRFLIEKNIVDTVGWEFQVFKTD